jgi:hypothetical protein
MKQARPSADHRPFRRDRQSCSLACRSQPAAIVVSGPILPPIVPKEREFIQRQKDKQFPVLSDGWAPGVQGGRDDATLIEQIELVAWILSAD